MAASPIANQSTQSTKSKVTGGKHGVAVIVDAAPTSTDLLLTGQMLPFTHFQLLMTSLPKRDIADITLFQKLEFQT